MKQQGTGNAETLLLTAGKTEGRFFQAILDFIEDRSVFQTGFNDFVQLSLVFDTVDPGTVSDIVVNSSWEKDWAGVEYHTGFFTQQSDIYVGIVDVLAVNFDLTGDLYIVHEIIHRFRVFKKVDLPQPEGPIKAVIAPALIFILMFLRA